MMDQQLLLTNCCFSTRSMRVVRAELVCEFQTCWDLNLGKEDIIFFPPKHSPSYPPTLPTLANLIKLQSNSSGNLSYNENTSPLILLEFGADTVPIRCWYYCLQRWEILFCRWFRCCFTFVNW